MVDYLAINSLVAGLSGGVIGAAISFLTIILGILKYSKAAKLMEQTVWKKYGYKVSWLGSLWGAVLGFIYGFVIWFFFALIYNWLI